jgi:molybdenum cofactor guanylyltransferase
VTAVILAGGAGRRMGGAVKPLIAIDGATILERQLAVLRPRVGAIVIAVGPGVDAPWATVPIVRDPVADGGPLAGIAAGLAAAATPWILAVAGDMPWLAPAVIDRILARAIGGAAVVPRIGGHPEPLLAAYHAGARAAIDDAVARGEKSPSRVVQRGAFEVAWLDEAEVRALDPALRTFASVNAPADLPGP